MSLWLETLAQSALSNKDKDLIKWAKEVTAGHAGAVQEYHDYLSGKTADHQTAFRAEAKEAEAAGKTLLAESLNLFARAAEDKAKVYALLETLPELSGEEALAVEDELNTIYKTALKEADSWNAQSRDTFDQARELVTPALGEERFKQVATPMRQDLSSGKYFDQDYRHEFGSHVEQLCKHAVHVVDEVHNNGGCSGATYSGAREAVNSGGPLEASLHYYARQFSIRQVGLIARDVRQLLRNSRDQGLSLDGTLDPANKGAAEAAPARN